MYACKEQTRTYSAYGATLALIAEQLQQTHSIGALLSHILQRHLRSFISGAIVNNKNFPRELRVGRG